jgi:hypothetical protein
MIAFLELIVGGFVLLAGSGVSVVAKVWLERNDIHVEFITQDGLVVVLCESDEIPLRETCPDDFESLRLFDRTDPDAS